jgi:homocysteine S-methyltransferase
MVNCAHPEHLEPTLRRAREQGAGWLERFKGLRANASRKSHEELDNSSELDRGDPRELAQQIADLQRAYDLQLVGGCCGTDAEHIAVLARALN